MVAGVIIGSRKNAGESTTGNLKTLQDQRHVCCVSREWQGRETGRHDIVVSNCLDNVRNAAGSRHCRIEVGRTADHQIWRSDRSVESDIVGVIYAEIISADIARHINSVGARVHVCLEHGFTQAAIAAGAIALSIWTTWAAVEIRNRVNGESDSTRLQRHSGGSRTARV